MQSSPIKKILVPLDLSPFADAATAAACSIAKKHHAQVEGIVALDMPEIMGTGLPYHAWLVPDALRLEKARIDEAKRKIADAQQHFARICEPLNVSHTEDETHGVPADAILEAASLHDLIVMGLRTHFHPGKHGEAGHSLDRILEAPNAPVLAMPKNATDPASWKKVLVAFDGSSSSCRALKEFARFAQPFDFEVTVIKSSKEKARAGAAVRSAAGYLRAHGISSVDTMVSDREIGKMIDEDYIETSDLVVAGIHSKKFVKDFFVGSLTKQLIAYGHTPLLLS